MNSSDKSTRKLNNDYPSGNKTSFAIDLRFIYEIGNITTYVVSFVGMVFSLVVIIAVWGALSRVSYKSLKPKFLLENVLLADAIISIGVGTRGLRNILMLYTPDPYITYGCFEMWIFGVMVWSGQHVSLSSLSLALDRFYSVLFPFHYMRIQYTKTVRICIECFLCLISIGLPAVIVCYELLYRDQITESWAESCLNIYGSGTLAIGPILILIFFALTIIVHCLTLVSVCVRRLRFTADEMSASQTQFKENVKMANTFLLIYFSYCLCIIPAPLVFVIKVYVYPFELTDTIMQLLMFIYSFNTLVDPVIIYVRVPHVKQSIEQIFAKKPPNSLSRIADRLANSEKGKKDPSMTIAAVH